ncbi:ASCH domain-containing protein [Leisingera sp. F5]|uniref:ASCH domain-containing protein n=1 Tax=Leisingera sp. F5 TaxID=1813816 RepID=UPI000ACC5BC4|nr:ASCH domain-containing protein [Leisingera sp. F5]
MPDLHIPLKGEYFDQIKAGMKPYEYRETTPYWRKRLVGRDYDSIILTRGYPSREDNERRMKLPYRGFRVMDITHPHFGPKPVEVFAIDVRPT